MPHVSQKSFGVSPSYQGSGKFRWIARLCVVLAFIALLLTPRSAFAVPLSPAPAAPVTEMPTFGSDSDTSLSASDHKFRKTSGIAKDSRAPVLVAVARTRGSSDIVSDDISLKSEGHVSLGERLAAFLKRHGISDALTVFILSAMPVVELRAGVPVGFLLGLHPLKTFLLAIAGNMVPVALLLLLFKSRVAQQLAAPLLYRARQKAATLTSSSSLATGLALFVGVPMPGTGAFTGSLIAIALGMEMKTSVLSLGAGVVMSATIMLMLCALGKIGAALAIAAMLGVGVSSMVHMSKDRSRDISSTSDQSQLINESSDAVQTE